MFLSRLDLPQPEPPRMTNTSPRLTEKLRFCSTILLPYPTVRSFTSIMFSAVAVGLVVMASEPGFVGDVGEQTIYFNNQYQAGDNRTGCRQADGCGTGTGLHTPQTTYASDDETEQQ